jgi:hypothetical protein
MDEQQRNTGVPLSVFISYAHEDEPLRQQLEAHLSLLRRQGLIADWQDRQILAGEEWARDIDEHLERASLILLLISPDFLASEYCYGIEMRRALERHQNGEAQVIPIIVRPVDWEGAPFAHLQCLPRDARAVTEWDNRDAAFRDIARGIRTAIEQLPSTFTQLQPVPAASRASDTVSAQAPAEPTDRNRQHMLKRVRATWIVGVLEQSLYGAALMVLGLEEKADVLDNPWRLLMQEVDRPAQPLPEGTRIIEIYNATEGGLLILGEPGAGKTTLLLELARDLLDRAQTDGNAPIPVVFNLSSWAEKRLTLSNWLVEELSMRYEVPHRLGQSWVSEDRLLLLLDGLDEVASAARKECIEAINNYRQTHPDVQVVVCSRSTEYLNEPTQLRLHTAVVIQPLTKEQIDTYLESAGEQAEALREALRQDADLRELATTPLILTILLFAYRGTSPDKISALTSLEAKREQIFASYVQHMLKRRGASKRYKPKQITHWLTYLAGQMKQQHQTVFYIEQMQPDWLLKVWPRSFYRALAGGVTGGLLCGLIGAAIGTIVSSIIAFNLFPSFLYKPIPWPAIAAGFVVGLIIGQILGSLIGLFRPKSTEIRTVEVITLSWANARLAAIASIVGGSLGALIAFHSSNFIFNRLVVQVHYHSSLYLLYAVVFLLLFLIISLLLEWICFMLMYLFTRRNLDGHRSIISRQKLWYAARRGVLVGILMICIGLTLLLLTGPVTSSLVPLTGIPMDIYLVAIGCVSGLLTGLVFGVSRGQLETHTSIKPNQGIWRSLYNGGLVLLIVGLIVWLVYDLFVFESYGFAVNQAIRLGIIEFPSQQFLTGVMVGISIGLFFGLLNGGLACIKHVLLRGFLWRSRALPWNCARFLDYAAERILLRKVGRGYIFVHRLLLEYFASLVIPLPEEATAVVVISEAPPILSSTAQIDTVPPEEKASLPVPGRKTGFNKEKRIVVLFIAVLLLEFSCGPGIFGVVKRAAQNTSDAAATAINKAYDAAATAQAEGQAQANATAEAIANASPIAYPPHNQSPALDDPLKDNSQGNNWEGADSSAGTLGTCQWFINRVFDINANQSESAWCLAKIRDFTNFIYEVQMKIVKGDGGGIAFRIDPASVSLLQRNSLGNASEGQLLHCGCMRSSVLMEQPSQAKRDYGPRSGGGGYHPNDYEFVINQDGSYSITAYTSDYYGYVFAKGFSPAIQRGLNQTNLVAAVVHGNIIELYVNHQRVAVVDSGDKGTYAPLTHGLIGVIASDTESNQTEVIFQNAKVWQL